jgi:hypothetical protein
VVGQGVFAEVTAAVVGEPVGVLALHLPVVEPTDDQDLEDMRVARSVGSDRGRHGAGSAGEQGLQPLRNET